MEHLARADSTHAAAHTLSHRFIVLPPVTPGMDNHDTKRQLPEVVLEFEPLIEREQNVEVPLSPLDDVVISGALPLGLANGVV